MEIKLIDDDRIRLTTREPGLSIEPGEGISLSPFHLFAASLALCTHSVLYGWGLNAGLDLEGLGIEVGWELGGDPYRVTGMEMDIDWPGLPDERRTAARNAAAQCTIHHTLEHGSVVETRVRAPGATAS